MLIHTSLGMGRHSAPNNFLTPEIEKLAKNLVYFGIYRRDLLGELGQTFRLDVTLLGPKISASDFGGPSPKNIWAVKRVFHNAILRLYCRYLQIGTRYRLAENGAA